MDSSSDSSSLSTFSSGRNSPDPEEIQIWVCLCNPSDIRNMGGAIRAVANYGLTGIKIISSHSLDERTLYYFSSGAYPEIHVQRYETLDEALHDATWVVGTSRRIHGPHAPPTYSVYEIDTAFKAQWSAPQGLHLLFGNERTGLVKEEIDYCQALIEVPTFGRFPSMNLSHAVACISHEISRTLLKTGQFSQLQDSEHPHSVLSSSEEEILSLNNGTEIEHLQTSPQVAQAFVDRALAVCTQIGYPSTRNPEHFIRKLRMLLKRANATPGEYGQILGLFREIERLSDLNQTDEVNDQASS